MGAALLPKGVTAVSSEGWGVLFMASPCATATPAPWGRGRKRSIGKTAPSAATMHTPSPQQQTHPSPGLQWGPRAELLPHKGPTWVGGAGGNSKGPLLGVVLCHGGLSQAPAWQESHSRGQDPSRPPWASLLAMPHAERGEMLGRTPPRPERLTHQPCPSQRETSCRVAPPPAVTGPSTASALLPTLCRPGSLPLPGLRHTTVVQGLWGDARGWDWGQGRVSPELGGAGARASPQQGKWAE